ncbi:hypothetical protein KDL44_11420 [bacterium]|nr:hypothetical protein [bacterium]
MSAANQKHYFLLRRLHSLSGIIPVGAFFLLHMFLNSRAAQSPQQYQWVPDFLDQIPYLWALEIGGIFVPILFHAILGVYIATKAEHNVLRPKHGWAENWGYTFQRITGALLFIMILVHLWQTWWVHTRIKLDNASNGTHTEFEIYSLMNGLLKDSWVMTALYALFVLIAAWHFGNGIYNFACKWGFATSRESQRFALTLGLGIGAIGVVLGFASIWGITLAPWASAAQ